MLRCISPLLFSNRPSGSSAFRLSTTPVSMSLTGSRFSSDSAPRPFHHGISKTRWNNLLGGLAVSMTAGPSGQTISPHPSSREGHHSTVGWSSGFSPIWFDPAQISSYCDFPSPPERGAVNPDAMHDHGQPTRQRHDRLLPPAMPGDLHRPGLEPGPFRRTHQHALGRFVEHHPHHLVSTPRYCAGSIVLAGLILGRRQSKHCSDCLGVPEAGRYIDGDAIGQRDHRADTRDGHQAPAHIIVPDDGQQVAMQDAELLANYPPDDEQRFHQHSHIGKTLDKLPNTRLELHRPRAAHLKAEVAQGGTEVVLDGDGLRLKQLAMGQQHPKLLTA